MRRSLPALLALVAALATSAHAAEYPEREVDRPLVLPPGTSEAVAIGEYERAVRAFDADARAARLPAGALQSSATAAIAARFGLFRAVEVWLAAPYIARLGAKGETPRSGTGRASVGGRYEVRPSPVTFVAASGGLVLPSTARRLRTGAGGAVRRDHLALSGGAAFKHVMLDATAAYGFAEIVFPFANEDDDAARRDPPATFRVGAGSLFQVEERLFTDFGVSFTRTNRDRSSGGVVPGSDRYRIDLRPALGVQLHPRLDARGSFEIPVAGKNTVQSFVARGEVRYRF